MDLLPLDDDRWKDLVHRGWSNRKPRTPGDPFVPEVLAKLLQNPADARLFNELWPYLCTEGTTWSAAYAAVPYIVQLAAAVRPEQRTEYLIAIGAIATDSCPEGGPSFEIKDYLLEGYQHALPQALALLAETLLVAHDVSDTRYLLGAAAALKGHTKLAAVLQDMDCICGDCPNCGEEVYPDELQQAIV